MAIWQCISWACVTEALGQQVSPTLPRSKAARHYVPPCVACPATALGDTIRKAQDIRYLLARWPQRAGGIVRRHAPRLKICRRPTPGCCPRLGAYPRLAHRCHHCQWHLDGGHLLRGFWVLSELQDTQECKSRKARSDLRGPLLINLPKSHPAVFAMPCCVFRLGHARIHWLRRSQPPRSYLGQTIVHLGLRLHSSDEPLSHRDEHLRLCIRRRLLDDPHRIPRLHARLPLSARSQPSEKCCASDLPGPPSNLPLPHGPLGRPPLQLRHAMLRDPPHLRRRP